VLNRGAESDSSKSPQGSDYNNSRGNKFYEISNHLGNVLTVINDKKDGQLDSATSLNYYGYYTPQIVSAADYYPFGWVSRNFQSNAYRYGFNGKERDDAVKGGEGTQLDYGMRIYDPRVGRFLSVDPLQKKYADLTPYQFASNTPIQAIDLDGLEKMHYTLVGAGTPQAHLQFDRIEHFSETSIIPVPGVNPFIFVTATILDPRVEFVVHESRRRAYDRYGTIVWYNQDVSKSFSGFDEAQGYIASNKNSIGYTWGDFGFGLMQGISYVAEEHGTGGVRFGKGKGGPVSRSAVPANEAHGGNPEAANANAEANMSFSYEGQTYEVKSDVPYKRPNNATTPAQRKAVNQPGSQCVTCGTTVGPFNADHITPLSVEQLSTGTIDKKNMRSTKAVQSQCVNCSNVQGGEVRKATQKVQEQLKNKQNGQKSGG
jgi:RHS repeat-associated protein